MNKLLQYMIDAGGVSDKLLPTLYGKASIDNTYVKKPFFPLTKKELDNNRRLSAENTLKEKRKNVYKTIKPSDYSNVENYVRYAFNNQRDEYDDARSEEGFRMYLGLENNPQYFKKSKYKPTINADPNGEYYSVDKQLEEDIFNSFKDAVKNKKTYQVNEYDVDSDFSDEPNAFWEGNKQMVKLSPNDDNLITGRPMVSRARVLGNFGVSRGSDKKGDYLSYYDQYDFPNILQNQMQGNPYKIYGRIYYNDQKQKGGLIVNARGKRPVFSNIPYPNKILERAQNGKQTGNPISNWWYNLDDVQSTYKMYNDLDPFLKNWYQNAETQRRLKENLANVYSSEDPKKLTNQAINTLQNTPIFSRELAKKADVSASDFVYNNKLQGWKSPSTIGGNPYFNSHNYITGTSELGSYDPNTKQIIVNSFGLPGTIAHEGVHATPELQQTMEDVIRWKYIHKKDSKARFAEKYGISTYDPKTNQIIPETFEHIYKRIPKLYDVLWKDEEKYLENDGMYPRIMDIRKTLNLKPGQKIDKSILENESIQHPLDNLKHYYNSDTIVDMINTLAKNDDKRKLNNAKKGGPIVDARGQWAHPGEITRIPSNQITMQGVPYPVLGIGNNGQQQMMYPNQEYYFSDADYVDEYPMMNKGGGILNNNITCSNCGWSWKASEGGADPFNCHKCGGVAEMNQGGEMIRRADGSYSRRGLWDNIRDNRGSGKKPTAEMLRQERKISQNQYGGPTLNPFNSPFFNSKVFLQPTSNKLPIGYLNGATIPSTERAISIGGENGEPGYLIPSFKYGKPLKDPVAEFIKTGEHLGGPFDTWQEADEWEQNVRHPYVEKGKNIPTPLKRWSKNKDYPQNQYGGGISVPTLNNKIIVPKQTGGETLANKIINARDEVVKTADGYAKKYYKSQENNSNSVLNVPSSLNYTGIEKAPKYNLDKMSGMLQDGFTNKNQKVEDIIYGTESFRDGKFNFNQRDLESIDRYPILNRPSKKSNKNTNKFNNWSALFSNTGSIKN